MKMYALRIHGLASHENKVLNYNIGWIDMYLYICMYM